MNRPFCRFSSFFLFLLILIAQADAEERSRLLNIRQGAGADHTRIVLDVQGAVEYEVAPGSDSGCLMLTLKNSSVAKGRQEVPVKSNFIRKVTVIPRSTGEAEVEFSFPAPARWNIFMLKGEGNKPNRLVVDIFKGEKKEAKKEKPEPPPPPKVEEKTAQAEVKAAPPEPKIEEPAPSAEETRPVKAPEKIETREPVPAAAKYRLLDMRQWSAPDHTRVVIDVTGRPSYEVLPAPDPLTWTLQLSNVALPQGGKEIVANDPVVRAIKLVPQGGDKAEIRIALVKPVRFEVFTLEPYLDKPNRLVIDFFRPDLEQKEKAERQVIQQLKEKKTRIIVIDPGHGGEDPGAIGPRKTQEKDIALALSRKLQKMLNESGAFRAFLTRRGDYFVSLNDRIKIAQEYGADLFISVHANASPKRWTRGTSVYCLSLKGASDKATQMLAQNENASDLIGGIGVGGARRDLDSILLDLQQTHTINESLQFAGIVLSELKRANYIQFSQPMQAGFAVLKAHNFPSILVETAYISHPIEEKFLKKETFQLELVKGLARAVQKFMPLISAKDRGPDAGKDASGG